LEAFEIINGPTVTTLTGGKSTRRHEKKKKEGDWAKIHLKTRRSVVLNKKFKKRL